MVIIRREQGMYSLFKLRSDNADKPSQYMSSVYDITFTFTFCMKMLTYLRVETKAKSEGDELRPSIG